MKSEPLQQRSARRSRSWNLPRALGAFAACGAWTLAGCASTPGDLELDAPDLTVSIELDRKDYRVGAPALAVVTVMNEGEKAASIPRPSWACLEFYLRPPRATEQRRTEIVFSPKEGAEHLVVPPGERVQREFLLPLLTGETGTYEVFCIYRTEVEEELVSAVPFAAPAAPFTVAEPAEFHRDSVGLISEEDATRVAAAWFAQPAAGFTAKLVRDIKTNFFVWWVTVRFATAGADGATEGSCFVCPYRGVVRGTTTEPAPEGEETDRIRILTPEEAASDVD